MDCFAEPVIGPAQAGRTRWLAMTNWREFVYGTGLPVYGIDAVRPPSTGNAWPLT